VNPVGQTVGLVARRSGAIELEPAAPEIVAD
jgi:hypothetical protein